MGKIRDILMDISDPRSGYSILEAGIVEKVVRNGKKVVVMLNLPKYGFPIKDYVVSEIKNKLMALPRIDQVIIEITNKTLRYPLV
jgi:metal-sulfur cluster biosynthetic enzyme